jgi:hypothetical protein
MTYCGGLFFCGFLLHASGFMLFLRGIGDTGQGHDRLAIRLDFSPRMPNGVPFSVEKLKETTETGGTLGGGASQGKRKGREQK